MSTTFPTFDFSDYRVVIAGGSKGIGRAMALAFAQAGAAVSICARGTEALEATGKELAETGAKVHVARCDLANADSVARYIEHAADALGGIDVLVNNGSGFGFSDDEDSWQRGLSVDVLAPVRASRHALPWLKASAHASILNIVSIAALRPRGGGAPYAAVKAAMTSYTSSQALALASDGIRVNAIAPGSIKFPGGLWEEREQNAPEVHDRTLANIPFGRFGEPEEIAGPALFLASPLAGWITGHTLVVDGGQMLNG
ncbi:SDR family NAD(P)-dependent oxidoreductase [Oleiagrimonas sp. C23AA]|uniref:SDR family NAD(P)-dependent oxidoreductase n=1 Tax=Oleiagrimonas sp. C23AA TaxID=2719047 RepID=UPI001423C7B9|nr:SDR family NAD(P)-dependent oxidoreductase [Oleiagrimonas sp. C23AA]NII09362.1 SDR family oxidoreductase [Oleiagrimonas sp. C23AA]